MSEQTHTYEPRHSRKTPNLGLIVTVVIQIVTWVFSAGMGWQKMTDLEKAVSSLAAQVQRLQDSQRPQLTRRID
jgi:hypothetical protein